MTTESFALRAVPVAEDGPAGGAAGRIARHSAKRRPSKSLDPPVALPGPHRGNVLESSRRDQPGNRWLRHVFHEVARELWSTIRRSPADSDSFRLLAIPPAVARSGRIRSMSLPGTRRGQRLQVPDLTHPQAHVDDEDHVDRLEHIVVSFGRPPCPRCRWRYGHLVVCDPALPLSSPRPGAGSSA